MWIYVVKSGDNVDTIAANAGISVETLLWDNQIEYPYRLAVGQALLIDNGVENPYKRPLDVNGYAYPFIRQKTAEATLPFVEKVRQVMNVFGYFVSVALVPKTSKDQRGLLYEGIDYHLLGEAANRAMLMTYEWGYTYEPIYLW